MESGMSSAVADEVAEIANYVAEKSADRLPIKDEPMATFEEVVSTVTMVSDLALKFGPSVFAEGKQDVADKCALAAMAFDAVMGVISLVPTGYHHVALRAGRGGVFAAPLLHRASVPRGPAPTIAAPTRERGLACASHPARRVDSRGGSPRHRGSRSAAERRSWASAGRVQRSGASRWTEPASLTPAFASATRVGRTPLRRRPF